MIPYVGREEEDNLKKVIEGKWLTEGPFTEQFVAQLKKITKAEFVVPVSSGTVAIYLALKANGIGHGDEVIVPSMTFCATASAVAWTGAKPVFVDVDRFDLNITAYSILHAITDRTRAVLPVHLYGRSCNMKDILEVAGVSRIKVIEDAAQGLGVHCGKYHVGTMGDAGILSFFADKSVTTGEGGAVLTNNPSIYKEIRRMRNQGRDRSGAFLHESVGMNFRLTDLQAAVGVAQLKKLPEIIRKKKIHYARYKKKLKMQFLKTPRYSNFVPFRCNVFSDNREEIQASLENCGVQTRRLFYPLHLQPCFEHLKHDKELYASEGAYNKGMSLPVYPGLKNEEIDYICAIINKVGEE